MSTRNTTTDWPPFSRVPSPDYAAAKVVLNLVADRDGDVDPLGSAVLIAPGLAVTAKHVVDGFAQNLDGRSPTAGQYQALHRLRAFQLSSDRGVATLTYEVFAASSPPIPSDLALLHIRRLESAADQWPCLFLDIVPPTEGAEILSYGFRARVDPGSAHIQAPLLCSRGRVTEVYPLSGFGFSKYPCVVTDARVDGAMSGGPVFSIEGNLLGVWSRSMACSDGGHW